MDETRVILLGLLQRGELYGYQVKKMLENGPLAHWAEAPVASLYNQLAKMADAGLVERVGVEATPGRPARAIFRITAEGRAELARLLRAAWLNVEPAHSTLDLAMFFIQALPETEVIAALRQRVDSLEAQAQRFGQIAQERAAEPGASPALLAVFDHFCRYYESELAWTRDLLARIEEGGLAAFAAAPAADARGATRQPRRATPGLGAFTFVLHSHLPYCRLAGRWPHGEEWIHEAAAETYIPLLNALYDLRDEGVPFKLTISITPILAEQLADADVREHFVRYLEDEIAAAQRDIPRFGEEDDAHLEYLATFYRDYYMGIRDALFGRYRGDIIGAFRQLQDEGYIEIITCAATHGYLPLLSRDSSIYGQLRAGVESYKRLFGRPPRAIWLPECAYRPAYVDEAGVTRPAIEEFLAGLGITCFFVETHAIEGGRPVGKAAGDVAIGPYGGISRRYVIPMAEGTGQGGTTYRAYYAVGSKRGLTEPPVAAIGRNNRTGLQVWSADWGYPGDADYREFHKKDHESGLQYWRVTGPKVDLGLKDYYHPDWAAHKVAGHAQHYAALVEELIKEYHAQNNHYGIVASNYDAELFGHWWFEGVEWIKQVLKQLSSSEVVDLVTASEYVAAHAPEQVMAVPESSWGMGGNHWTWDNPDTRWVWEPIHAAERRMEQLAARNPNASGQTRETLNQAARELLLLQSSDWPFLITTGQARKYATERFNSHVERFQQLADLAEAGLWYGGAELAAELYERDKVFEDIDYRWFAARQGRADG